jgi:hypothetical protein
MTYNWEPDTQYNLGDVVVYQGVKYSIVQPHRSQSDWTPPVTPALWKRVPEAYGGDSQQHQQQPQQPSYGGYGDNNDHKKWDEHQTQKVDIPKEEKKKNWYDLDDDRKRQLEIGGGLAAGAALLAGGYMAYKHHENKEEEEKKAQAWGAQNWVGEAQSRTQDYHASGSNNNVPVQWVLVHGKQIPENAIRGGAEQNGTPIFICRAYYEGSVQVGKAASHFNEGGVIGYGHQEVSVPTYEILVGDQRSVHWVDQNGDVDLKELGAKPVEAGHEADGTPLYIAQGLVEGSTQPGKCSTKLRAAFIPYGGSEKEVKSYRVLCLNN